MSGNDVLPLLPFPEGWYFVASRRSIRKAGLIQKTWMGEEIVAWCDGSGRVCVAEATCAHLGAQLGPAAGGRVRDGRLVCPFHGFEYDVTGQCVATPSAAAPESAKLRVFETREVLGLVFAWWGNGGRPPQWSLPENPATDAGWSALGFRTVRFPGHPQETTENSVDIAHLRYVHGYDNVSRVGPVSVDGAHLTVRFDFTRTTGLAGLRRLALDVSAVTHVSGLGYSFVEIREHSIGMDLRLWILATPVDGNLIDLSLAGQVREISNPRRWILGLGFLPGRLRAPIMNKFMASQQEKDVLQDVVIWSRKQYKSRPRLCRSDGELMPFRAYCAQFYPDPDASDNSLA
jgi:nitrite reductase/ring-hydroxylating ferredoxin subunit